MKGKIFSVAGGVAVAIGAYVITTPPENRNIRDIGKCAAVGGIMSSIGDWLTRTLIRKKTP